MTTPLKPIPKPRFYYFIGMLNGLRKIVGKGTPEVDENNLITSTPDFSTPCVKSNKKRKVEASSTLSSRKKYVHSFID
jgi:hypothetical protein